MNERMITDLLLSMTFSLFGMLLIFGLGFVFPTVNPYIVIKWIVVVVAVVFTYTIFSYLVRAFLEMKQAFKKGKKGGKK